MAIFTDGAGLRRRLEHPLQRAASRRLLAALQHWPRLCFVDCSPDGEQLAALFAAHRLRLETVAVPQLADWLGATRHAAPRAPWPTRHRRVARRNRSPAAASTSTRRHASACASSVLPTATTARRRRRCAWRRAWRWPRRCSAVWRWPLSPSPPTACLASRCRSCAREAIHDHPTLAAQTLRVVEADGAGGYRLTLGSPRDAVTLAGVAADAELTLDWRWAAGDNGVRPGGDSVLLRAGTLPQASRACTAGWPCASLQHWKPGHCAGLSFCLRSGL